MNPLLKGAIAFGTVAGVGGTSYGIYNAIQTTPEKVKTYLDEFRGTLLPTSGAQYDQNWKDRLSSLQAIDSDSKLVQGLKDLKTNKPNVEQWKTLRTWCQNTITNTSKGSQDQEFQNIQNYCTYSVKEKLGEKVILDSTTEDGGKWATAHGKLANIPNLNTTLEAAKAQDVGTGKTAVKDWCNAEYKKPYKGEADPEFKLAQKVCVSS